MPAVAFQGCFTTGHGCWHPTIIAPSDPLRGVRTALMPVALFGDPTIPHCCPIKSPCACHFGVCAGPNTVLVNLRPLQTLGMPITCGPCGIDFIAAGNPQVLCGGF